MTYIRGVQDLQLSQTPHSTHYKNVDFHTFKTIASNLNSLALL